MRQTDDSTVGHECPRNLSSVDSGFDPDGHCMHGIPSGACKICIPSPVVGKLGRFYLSIRVHEPSGQCVDRKFVKICFDV